MRAAPDYNYWAKLSYWTIEQSTALLIGADPDAILDGAALASSCPATARTAYLKIFRLLDSHIRMSGIGSNISPTDILKWAAHTKIDAPQALVEAVRAQGRTLIETRAQTVSEEKPLGERERNTLLRMIIGMAIGGYGYDPEAGKSDVAPTIFKDLDKLGLEGTEQTIRNKLREASQHLPGDWKSRWKSGAN